MTPDEKAALRYALLVTAVTAWCVWIVWPVSQTAVMVLLIAWLFGICFLVTKGD